MEDGNADDVAKALAAFGAPPIRYHSFGQLSVRAEATQQVPLHVPAADTPAPLADPAWQDVRPEPPPRPAFRRVPARASRPASRPDAAPEPMTPSQAAFERRGPPASASQLLADVFRLLSEAPDPSVPASEPSPNPFRRT